MRLGDKIAVTAPSSGTGPEQHDMLRQAKRSLESMGFQVAEGRTIWTNEKCVSAPRETRARELEAFLADDEVKAIIPPWGGEFLMELLPLIDWERWKAQAPKWLLGYSDISTLLFVYTLLTGHATAHGPNYFDVGSESPDELTARCLDVLRMGRGAAARQTSSSRYRSSWHNPPDSDTRWEILGGGERARFSGRLIGGCLDTLSSLPGTRYAPVESFVRSYCEDSGVIWYLESCEMNAADIYRSLWQMEQSGWFRRMNGVLIGRPAGYSHADGFELTDALSAVFGPMGIPVVYNADIGHVPPQLTLVNGALAEVSCSGGRGELTMTLS
nr:S66 peptidase family protein [Cohnella lubricantis]